MTKVLSANFMRLKKDRVFWIGVVFMFAAAPPSFHAFRCAQSSFIMRVDIRQVSPLGK